VSRYHEARQPFGNRERLTRTLERYRHLTPELRAPTVNLIATELFRAKQVPSAGDLRLAQTEKCRKADNLVKRFTL
jgi:hypothetical protein